MIWPRNLDENLLLNLLTKVRGVVIIPTDWNGRGGGAGRKTVKPI